MSLLLGMSAVAMILIAAIGAVTLRERMLDDRLDKLRAMVDSGVALAGALEAKVGSRELTREQALALFRQDIRGIRFDGGTGHLSAIDAGTGAMLMHDVNASLPNDSVIGQSISTMLIEPVRASEAGVASYMFPKPGQTQPLRKITALARFRSWNMVLLVGAYTDDLDAAFETHNNEQATAVASARRKSCARWRRGRRGSVPWSG
jgi:methyl-accepting chemotaxis protein